MKIETEGIAWLDMDIFHGEELYCDGGVIGRNPSPVGGTWAWRRTRGPLCLQESSGLLLPADLGVETISNNNSELLALLTGLECLPDGWTGRCNSDSQIALGWVFQAYSQEKIPETLRARLNNLRHGGRLSGIQWRLLQGHPTETDLLAGVGAKRGLPVSRHNVWCDAACKGAAEAFLRSTES
jgi:hypothetical protein